MLLGYDDSLDAFGVHGVGGFLGAMLTGVFAAPVRQQPRDRRALRQHGAGHDPVEGLRIVAAYDAIATFLILMVIRFTLGLRVSEAAEEEGLDLALHGEQVQ